MPLIAYAVPVLEFERGWGNKVDDYLLFLSKDEALEWIKEFNTQNDSPTVPDWYMIADSAHISTVEVDQAEHWLIEERGRRIWKTDLLRLRKEVA